MGVFSIAYQVSHWHTNFCDTASPPNSPILDPRLADYSIILQSMLTKKNNLVMDAPSRTLFYEMACIHEYHRNKFFFSKHEHWSKRA